MIRIALSETGTVSVRGKGADLTRLRRLQYLRWSRDVAATWWTHLGDLRRDLSRCQISWDPHVASRLRAILHGVETNRLGDDERILACFAPDATPYPFQVEGIHCILNVRRLLVGDDTGLGKQHPGDTRIMTPQGWRAIETLSRGDAVIGSNGAPTRVVGLYPQGVKPSYRVRFSDGSSVEAGPEHLWSFDYLKGGRRWSRLTLTTDQLRLRPTIGKLDLSKTRLRLPMLSGPVQYAKRSLPIHPYMLGALIANGCLGHGTPQLTYAESDWSEIKDRLRGDLGRERRYGTIIHVSVRGIVETIRDLGLAVHSKEKRIPSTSLTSAPWQRSELLWGLMDADGSASKTRNRLTYHTSSPGLARDVRELIEGLGGISSVRSYDRAEKGTDYAVRIRIPPWVQPFRLERKLSRYQPKSSQALPSRVVESVEYVRDTESYCIAVEAEDRLYATEHAILTHNTIQTIGAMLVALQDDAIERAVIVVPAGLKLQWYEEIHRFASRESLPDSVLVMAGEKSRREYMYRQPWTVLIVNPELVRRDVKILKRIVHRVGFVALDEASCIRNPDTATARAMKALFARTQYRVALTATPLENKLADLRSVFEWVDPRCFPSRLYFNLRYVVWRKRTFTVTGKNGRTYKIKKLEPKGYKNLNEVRAKIRPCFIRRQVGDVGLQLPALIVKWEMIQLGPAQRRVYEAIKTKVAEEIKGLRGKALTVPLQGLRQSCNSTALVERGATRRPLQAKVDRLVELLETDLAGEQVLCFTDYERWARMLGKQLGAITYTGKLNKQEKRRALDQFRHGDKRILIATKAGERGHNLQCAGVIVNLDMPWNPASLKQRLGRVRRIGSRHQCVRMINMIAAGTIEETLILQKVYAKRKLFEGIFEADELSGMHPLGDLTDKELRGML